MAKPILSPAAGSRRSGGAGGSGDASVAVVTDLTERTHQLGRAPALVDTQVGDDVGHVLATVGQTTQAREGTLGEGDGVGAGSTPSNGWSRLPISEVRRSSREIVAENPEPNEAV